MASLLFTLASGYRNWRVSITYRSYSCCPCCPCCPCCHCDSPAVPAALLHCCCPCCCGAANTAVTSSTHSILSHRRRFFPTHSSCSACYTVPAATPPSLCGNQIQGCGFCSSSCLIFFVPAASAAPCWICCPAALLPQPHSAALATAALSSTPALFWEAPVCVRSSSLIMCVPFNIDPTCRGLESIGLALLRTRPNLQRAGVRWFSFARDPTFRGLESVDSHSHAIHERTKETQTSNALGHLFKHPERINTRGEPALTSELLKYITLNIPLMGRRCDQSPAHSFWK